MNRRESNSGERIFGADTDATVRASWLYYHHDLTQAEIAKQLQVSRPTVANLLARARNRGIVSISLRPDLLGRLSLARIKPVIAVAGGEDKVEAVLGALRTGCLDILITDERPGRKVLGLDSSTASQQPVPPARRASREDAPPC